MLIIVGTKSSKKKVGWVADVCAFCRDVKPFQFFEYREVGHLYYLPLGRGKVQGYEIECVSCKESWGAELEDYLAIRGEPSESIEDLIDETNPGAPDDLEQWLELEECCESGQGTDNERQQLFLQLIDAINPNVHQKANSFGFDWRVWGWIVMTVLLTMGLVGIILSGWNQFLAWIGIAVVVVSFGFLLRSLGQRVARIIRRKYGSHLVESLILFEPSRAELQVVLTLMKESDMEVGKYLHLDWLYEDLLAAGMPESQRTPEKT